MTVEIFVRIVWTVFGHMAGESKNKKSKGEQSDLCGVEQVTLKLQLQADHCLITWLQIWYHSLQWRDSIRKGADLENQSCFFGVHPAVMGNLLLSSFWKHIYTGNILFNMVHPKSCHHIFDKNFRNFSCPGLRLL